MHLRNLLSAGAIAGVAACSGGDINIGTGGGGDNTAGTSNPNSVCASYSKGGQTFTGSFDAASGDCTYSTAFADSGNELTVDLTIPALANNGAHIFLGSLFVGEAFDSDADLTAAGISQGGDGPTLTIQPGATLAFADNSKFMIVNRGSQIIADGTSDAPITLTSLTDVNGSVAFDDVQQWGGVVINGFGVSNKCAYTGDLDPNGDDNTADSTLAVDGECHIAAEGAAGNDASFYGGDNNTDSSGILDFVIVKHTGAEVANGDELNGISFGGVGNGTQVSNLQVYSTFDDGIEMFGGEFDITNFVALYVRDDSIDVDEGYRGTITNALVIQNEALGNHCIESDGIGSYSGLTGAERQQRIDQSINSRLTVDKFTCIASASPDSPKGPGAGLRFREGIFANIVDAVVLTAFAANDETTDDDNYCLRIDNNDAGNADDNFTTASLTNTLVACQELYKDGATGDEQMALLGDPADENAAQMIASGTALDPTAASDPSLVLLEGVRPIFSVDYDNAMINAAPAPGAPESGDFVGALQADSDFTSPWAFGISPTNRAAPLWFE